MLLLSLLYCRSKSTGLGARQLEAPQKLWSQAEPSLKSGGKALALTVGASLLAVEVFFLLTVCRGAY